MGAFPTYAFDDSGRVAAFDGNQLIASGTDFDKVACTAEEYFNELRKAHKKTAADHERKTATHITTPNGDKGVILGRTASLWSDEITVRFENGQIRRYATFVGDGMKFSTEEPQVITSPVEYFQQKLDEAADPGVGGLTARLDVLDEVRNGAARLASQGVSYRDGQALHQIVLTAEAERNEVHEALDYLVAADAEAIAPPKMAYQAVEQATLGSSNDWLEVVAQEMIAESEAVDYDKLLVEGPTEFVSSLDTATIGNAGTVREMAVPFIHTKTAGFQGEAVEEYRDKFVANVERARKLELSYRKEAAKTVAKKEAKVTKDVPDEALFL